MKNKKISLRTARILIETKCVDISLKKKFLLTSGKKSPCYCDCRRLISFPTERKKIVKFAVQKLNEENILKKVKNIAGGESAGMHFASFISQKMDLPLSYIEKKRKNLGEIHRRIEGIIKPNQNVLLVEDLMTDGGSKVKFIESILKAKAKIDAIFVIFNYGINIDFFEFKKKIKVIHLTTWQDVLSEYTYLKKLATLIKIKSKSF